ncbi:hypothetical protein GYH30_013170 [Glycine max]|uniref:Uncharacterized protein n=1 Tax=Glycine max TaxID=3847 RepID=K7KR75_SOYBN|nr:hypothetical protein GYH30_013170 [Glycine max]
MLNIIIDQANQRINIKNILDLAQLMAGRHNSPSSKLLRPLSCIKITNIIRSDTWNESRQPFANYKPKA